MADSEFDIIRKAFQLVNIPCKIGEFSDEKLIMIDTTHGSDRIYFAFTLEGMFKALY